MKLVQSNRNLNLITILDVMDVHCKKCNLTPKEVAATVQPAKSDSDVMFCLQSYTGLIID